VAPTWGGEGRGHIVSPRAQLVSVVLIRSNDKAVVSARMSLVCLALQTVSLQAYNVCCDIS